MSSDKIIAFLAQILAAEPTADAFPTLTDGGADPRYPVAVTDCPRPIGTFDIEGRTMICGLVNVPENHAEPDGRRIDLSFVVLKSHSLSPAPDPLVYLHGGPGYGTVENLRTLDDLFDQWRQRRDIVTFDQRAAGLSATSVSCFDTTSRNALGLSGLDMGAVEAGAEGPGVAEPNAVAYALVGPCIEELAARGVDLPRYNTTENARDVRAVLSALGYPTYNIYGISYGTILGLEVMRTAPEGVRSVVLDSVWPPDKAFYDELAGPHDEAAAAIFDQCAADPDCAAAYPDLLNRFNALMDKLAEEPIPAGRVTPPISPTTVVEIIQSRNFDGSYPGLTGLIPLMVHQLERGDTDLVDAFFLRSLPPPPGSHDAAMGAIDSGLTDDETAMALAVLRLAEQRRAGDEATLYQTICVTTGAR